MNVHDSERLSGSLEAAGYVPADGSEADIVVINTCAVRENADNKLYGNLGHLASVKKRATTGMQIAVGGCLAQKDKAVILDEGAVGRRRLRHAQHGRSSDAARARPAQRRGAARDPRIARRLPLDPADEARLDLQRLGVDLGRLQQHLHVLHRAGAPRQGERPPARRRSWPRSRPSSTTAPSRSRCSARTSTPTASSSATGCAFGKLLRAAGAIAGLERIRFTSPHPAAFTDDVIDAMAETPSVMPQLHMPLQSGSDRILKAMRRCYRSDEVPRHPRSGAAQIPHAAISTDIIVGFPGETEEDFAETLRVVEQARFASAFTFQYSIRPGTPAADHARSGARRRSCRSATSGSSPCRTASPGKRTRRQVGRDGRGPRRHGRGAKRRGRLTVCRGRAEDCRLVHFEVPLGATVPRPGDVVTVAGHRGGAVLPDRRRRRPEVPTASGARAPATPGIAPQAASCGVPGAAQARDAAAPAGCRSASRPCAWRRPIYDARRRADHALDPVAASSPSSGRPARASPASPLDLADGLARRGLPAEIVNADAMQLYRGMDIGTAKLPPAERRGIPHHLLDVLDVTDEASVEWYQRDGSRRSIDEILSAGCRRRSWSAAPVCTSRACIFDFRFPGTDAAIRARLRGDSPTRAARARCTSCSRERDPAPRPAIGPHNGRRLVRALEVGEITGEPFVGGAARRRPCRGAARVSSGSTMQRDVLVERLDRARRTHVARRARRRGRGAAARAGSSAASRRAGRSATPRPSRSSRGELDRGRGDRDRPQP